MIHRFHNRFSQSQSPCRRSERTYCAVCYWSTAFKMSVPNAANGNNGVDTQCGSPGINPVFTKGGGWVEPGPASHDPHSAAQV